MTTNILQNTSKVSAQFKSKYEVGCNEKHSSQIELELRNKGNFHVVCSVRISCELAPVRTTDSNKLALSLVS